MKDHLILLEFSQIKAVGWSSGPHSLDDLRKGDAITSFSNLHWRFIIWDNMKQCVSNTLWIKFSRCLFGDQKRLWGSEVRSILDKALGASHFSSAQWGFPRKPKHVDWLSILTRSSAHLNGVFGRGERQIILIVFSPILEDETHQLDVLG